VEKGYVFDFSMFMVKCPDMDEIGVVKSLHDPFAIVVVEKKSACDQCSMGCKVSDSGAEIEALNLAKASVGQTVKVRMRAYTYMKGSLLVYGVPALLLIIGAVVGREVLGKYIVSIDRDLLSAIAGFTACFLGFVLVKIISSRMEKSVENKPVIEEIV